MYPTEVPHRLAKKSCSGTSRELRYVRSASISDSLLGSKILSIPVRTLPIGNRRYNPRMDFDDPLDPVRTANFLDILRTEHGGSPKKFEVATGYPANMVSQIKNGHKFVGNTLARKLEKLMKKERGVLDSQTDAQIKKSQIAAMAKWPLSISIADFEALSPKTQRELDDAFTKMVIGAQAQETLNKQRKHGT